MVCVPIFIGSTAEIPNFGASGGLDVGSAAHFSASGVSLHSAYIHARTHAHTRNAEARDRAPEAEIPGMALLTPSQAGKLGTQKT